MQYESGRIGSEKIAHLWHQRCPCPIFDHACQSHSHSMEELYQCASRSRSQCWLSNTDFEVQAQKPVQKAEAERCSERMLTLDSSTGVCGVSPG